MLNNSEAVCLFITSIVVKNIVLERHCFLLPNLDLFSSTAASPYVLKEFLLFSAKNGFPLGIGTLNYLKANEKCATLIVVTLILSTNMNEVCLLSIMSDFVEIYKLSKQNTGLFHY